MTKPLTRSKGRPRVKMGAGRPSTYTVEIGDRICTELKKGRSLIKACEDEGMPNRYVVVDWLTQHPEFAAKYDRARESQADYMDDLILDTANASTAGSSNADRVKIGAYQWRAGRLQPKKYGDRVQKEITGADGGPIKFDVGGKTDAQLAALEEALGGSSNAGGRAAGDGTGREGEESS